MYLDWTYIVLVLPAVIFSMWASARVNKTFAKYSKQMTARGLTGAQAARYVLDRNGLTNVQIEHISGNLTDHYDPSANVIRLSDSVYGSTSTAAIGVACHETGHAIQHAVGYVPVKIRTAIVPITNVGAKLSIPMIVIGLLLASFGQAFISLAYAGCMLFGLSVIFQLVTLPTEFNASNRALKCIEGDRLLVGDELDGAKQTLRAAAMTYVAALAVTVMQFLRLLLMVAGSDRRN